MPATFESIKIVRDKQVLTKVSCDICGLAAPEIDEHSQLPNWNTAIEHTITVQTIESSDHICTVKTWYICPTCFDKIFANYKPSHVDSW
jgi:hypothetical protein